MFDSQPSTAETTDPRDRDRLARADLSRPPGSRRLQAWLVGLSALLVSSVTALELGLAPPSLPIARAELERSLDDGPIALNRTLLAAMDRFEDGRNERSIVATALAPWVQWLQVVGLGTGDHQARLGRDGWLFFRPAVELVTGPGFLAPQVLDRRRRASDSWEPPVAPDPRPAILGFHRDLADRGIELVLLPVPTKAQIHPNRLSRRVPVASAPLHNPSWSALLEGLSEAGIRVVDPTDRLLTRAGSEDRPQFLARDTHWTPAAMEETATLLAEALAETTFSHPSDPGWSRSTAQVAHAGDLTEMLGLPEGHRPWPDEEIVVHPVTDPQGLPWEPRPDAEILLLGDSFSNVYSTPDLGWGTGAGLAEQLSWSLERTVDRIAINAGGASGARQRLAAELSEGRNRLAGKRVVIWEVSSRELATGDWAVTPLAAPTEARRALPRVPLGDGLVVWESNRTGSWRLFARPLAGGEARQISPDEPGLQHCCPHFSPDGTRIAYLSRTVGENEYPKVEVPGELRLLTVADGKERVLSAARNYGWGNRAVVWRDDRTLIFVDAQGRTAELDVEGGKQRLLIDAPRKELGFLLDPGLDYASSAAPTFSPYRPQTNEVAERSGLGGCEPYFSSDGRWGYWNAGPGGPIQRIDPATREIEPLILREDPRLPSGWRYLYFVMTSRDDRAMAWGASNGDHDHFAADYEIFVAPTDPDTLELTGQPQRITHDPATDRYPDVHLAPLALGHHRVEAPHTATFESPDSTPRRWTLNGREVAIADRLEHHFDRPGTYRIEARRESGESDEGIVVVEPARPPSVIRTRLRDGGRRLRVELDEPVRDVAPAIETDPGGIVGSWRRIDRDRTLEIDLTREVTEGLRVRIRGFVDLAQSPNPLSSEWIEVAAPDWPTPAEDLLFSWENGRAPNLVFDPGLGADRASSLSFSGRSFPDRHHALVLDGGSAETGEKDSQRITERLETTLEVSLEVVFAPASSLSSSPETSPRRLLALEPRRGRPLLELAQRGSQLELTLLTSEERTPRPIPLATIESGRPHHLALSATAAKLQVLLDGRVLELPRQPAGSFGPWRGKSPRLVLGTDTADTTWRGTVERLAIWGRALGEEDLREAFVGARRAVSARPEIERRRLAARLVARSPIPTLDEITPYRSGLVVFEWQPVSNPEGASLEVVHWALLDGERQPVTDWPTGTTATLVLEPLDDQPQLEPYTVSDHLPSTGGSRWLALTENLER